MWRTWRRGPLLLAVPLALLLASPLGHTTHPRPTRGTPVNLLAVNAEQTLTLAVPTLSERPTVQRASRGPQNRHRRPQAAERVTVIKTDLWALVASYRWPADTAWRIMLCESGGNPNAANRHSSARGLFQILGGSFDPEENVAHAFRMWQARGWQPWNASRRCWA